MDDPKKERRDQDEEMPGPKRPRPRADRQDEGDDMLLSTEEVDEYIELDEDESRIVPAADVKAEGDDIIILSEEIAEEEGDE